MFRLFKYSLLFFIFAGATAKAQYAPAFISCAGSNWTAAHWGTCVVDGTQVAELCTNAAGCTNQSQFVVYGGGTVGLVNSVSGTANEIACNPTTGSVVCNVTNPLVIGSGPSSSWFTGTGGLIGLPQGTCTGTIPAGSDWLCDSSTGLQYGPASGTFANLPTTSAGVVGLFTSCSGTQYLGADGACHTAGVTGGTCTNQATTAISTAGVPTCTTITSSYVDTSIAKTGTDINTSNQVTNGSNITNSSIPNSGLAHPSTTVNGQSCVLGSTCNISTGGTYNGYGMWQLTVPSFATWVNQGNATTKTGTNFQSIMMPGQSSGGLAGLYNACPSGFTSGTLDWYALVLVSQDMYTGAGVGGLIITDGTVVAAFTTLLQGSSSAFLTGHYSSATGSFTSVYSQTGYPYPGPIWWHLHDASGTITTDYSFDGTGTPGTTGGWHRMGVGSSYSLSAVTNCGFYALPGGASSPISVTVLSSQFVSSLTAQ